ncbi:hypothetical protein D4R89_05930 [bacterium]|nr:MAG: hypothetical protein D4R89_05930 [bacterium]
MASSKRIIGIFGLVLGIVFLMAGGMFGQEKTEAAKAGEEQAVPAKPASEFEGTVKIGLGKYFYLPSAQGFDIAVQGQIESGDASNLTGKDIKVRGELLADKPSIFRADSIEMKDASGSFRNVFTRTQDLVLDDYLDPQTRDGFQELKITNALKNEEWEGKGKVRIYGKILKDTTPATILLTDEKNKEVGKIIIDKFTDYANYYMNKLRLFDKFWFYLDIKNTVDKKVRTKSRELFHADIVFCGLY